jgi:preprotein translocase subunit YajC
VEFAALMLQPAGPKAGTPAAEAPAAAANPGTATQGAPPSGAQSAPPPPQMGIFGSPLFFILLFLPFIFIMWRRNKKETEARTSIKKGDKVVAGAGLVGEVMDMDERVAKVKIAPGVNVQVLTSALAPFQADTKPAADAKDAKAKAEKAASNKGALESK